MVGSVTAT